MRMDGSAVGHNLGDGVVVGSVSLSTKNRKNYINKFTFSFNDSFCICIHDSCYFFSLPLLTTDSVCQLLLLLRGHPRMYRVCDI